MPYATTRLWGPVMAQGVVAILFGLLILIVPLATLITLVYVFAAFVLADGIVALISAFLPERTGSRGLLALYGIAGIGIGLLALFLPGITLVTFLYLIVAWALIIGIVRIFQAISLPRDARHRGALLFTGIVSVVFALFVLFTPGGLAALVLALGIYLLVSGVLLVVAALRLRSLQQEFGGRRAPPPETGGTAGPAA